MFLSGSGQIPCPSGCCELTERRRRRGRRRRRRSRRRRTRRRRRRRRETQRRNFCPGATHALPSNPVYPTTAGASKITSINGDHDNAAVAVSDNDEVCLSLETLGLVKLEKVGVKDVLKLKENKGGTN